MTVNLVKGQKADLTKTNPGLTKIGVGLGWDVNQGNGPAFDLDSFVIIKSANAIQDIVYFNNLKSKDGAVVHAGDNLTGHGDGDDEEIFVDLTKLDSATEQILIAVNIYEAAARRQNFGMVRNAFCRIFNQETNEEIMKYDLTEDYSSANCVVFGKLYRHNGEIKFEVMSEPMNGNINEVVEKFK